jgi:hypothetical protein
VSILPFSSPRFRAIPSRTEGMAGKEELESSLSFLALVRSGIVITC